MRNTKVRSILLYMLIFIFFAGMSFFIYEFSTEAEEWAFSPINKHISEGGMTGGKIVDANGVILAETVNGKRMYNENEGIRRAMLHTVGDGSVLIPTSVQSRYSDELFGYNFITGFGAPHVLNNNKNLKLTLDSNICSNVAKSFKNQKGAALAYNYLTGKVICMVSLPNYDINNRPDLSLDNDEKYEGVYINRAISSIYTPGSIFKIFTTAAAIDLIDNVEKRTFECNKVKIVDGEKITCMSSHGKINLRDALAKSCDIVFGDLAIELGKNNMKEKMKEFGFNKPQYFESVKVAQSKYEIDDATRGDLGWSGIGQYRDQVSPLHMLRVMGAIANKGMSVEPFVVNSTFFDGSNEESYNFSKGQSTSLMKSETAEKLKDMMRYTMKNQYKDSMFGGIEMCAKTGTAEVGEGKKPHGWMVGFSYDKTFPVAFSVIVENGDFGIRSAGPIASNMIKDIKKNYKM